MIRTSLLSLLIVLALRSLGCDCTEVRSKLADITEMPYIPELSGDIRYWEIVTKGLNAVPCLIELLSDTMDTCIPIPNFGDNYKIGDIAHSALQDIIHGIPIADIIPVNDTVGGYWIYLNYTTDYTNRISYQKKLEKWYQNNHALLLWKEDTRIYRTSTNWPLQNRHPAGGYYIIP
jgi:hypothetical protein